MHWKAKPTGDMTLSVLDENDFQILKVDMLSQNTMQAGLDGSKLTRTLNDLTIIAHFADMEELFEDILPYEDDGYSARPWSVTYNAATRTLKVSSGKKKICDRKFPASTPSKKIEEIYSIISNGIEKFNAGLC